MTSTYILKSEDYYRNFKESIKSKETLNSYDHKLKAFMKYKGITADNFADLIEDKDTRQIEADIIDFMISLKKRCYTLNSQQCYLNALIHFYSINDVIVRRKKIAKFLSNDDIIIHSEENSSSATAEGEDSGGAAGEKPYTHQQIAKLLEFSDLRTKAVILIMASAGLRLGALEILKMADLIRVSAYKIYQIRIYANSKSNRHYTFCTPECRKAIDNYLDYRKQCGENITSKSPVLRSEFDREDIFQAANEIRPISRFAIKHSLQRVLYASGIRTPVVSNSSTKPNTLILNYRRDIPMAHGFRKFFDTTCTYSGMNPIYIEWCMGHKLKGVKDSYFNPQPDSNGIYMDILEGHDKSPGYIDAIDFLTINEENRLRHQVEKLTIRKDELESLQKQVEVLHQQKGKWEILEEKMNELDRRLGFAP